MTDQPRRKHRARLTARAVLVHQDHVLMLRGLEADGSEWYVVPGGGVEHGETMAAALERELKEETGIEIEALHPIFLREFIADRHPGRSQAMPVTNHALAVIFLCRLKPGLYDDLPLSDIGEWPGDVDGSGAMQGMDWLKISEIENYDVRPPHLSQALAAGQHLRATLHWWPEDNPPADAENV